MKKTLLLILFLLSFLQNFANHIAGGELFYEYLGAGAAPNTSKYKITMRLFRDCNSTGQILDDETVNIGIYENSNRKLLGSEILPLISIQTIKLNTSLIPCLTNAPSVCFQIGLFSATVDIKDTAAGYTLLWIRCCRSDNIANMSQSTGVGASFVTHIPGTSLLPVGHNSSPQFLIKDTSLVCRSKQFVLDFGATDADGDVLNYSFCSGYGGGTSSAPQPAPPSIFNLNDLSYRSPYSGSSPLGASVAIDPLTGRITGTAPAAGRYVVNVCVTETRNGVVLNEHRKDFILQVGDCDYAGASPTPVIPGTFPAIPNYQFVSCKSFSVLFLNNNNSPTITNYYWDFGVPGITTDTSTSPFPTYVFPDTGFYTIKLKVNGPNNCVDSNNVTVGIYPGFKGDFSVTGSCYKNPFLFKDKSTTTYGVINSWRWNFGEASTTTDTSTLQNTSYKYPNPDTRNATLLVSNSNGCLDTIVKPVVVRDIPLLVLPFHDTLICTIDTLPLIAQGNGTFTWTPAYNIINPTTANPLVFPKDTTTYVVTMLEDGCVATDSIKVNTLDFITVDAGRDTTICRSDIITLFPVSYGLQYRWTPTSAILGNPNIKNPQVSPFFNDEIRTDTVVTYHVVANLGKCTADDYITIRAVRYPIVDAGPDDSICYGRNIQLHATIKAASFTWFPQNSLINANTLNPISTPRSSTTYTLTVTDTIGCPKPSSDNVVIKVIPPVVAYAGNDTNIVVNQLLQLNATGGDNYLWTPSTGLDNPFIANPMAQLGPGIDSITYTVKATSGPGCFGVDQIKVVVFKTGPNIFVPSAFTPNGDGKNDILKPLLVGLKSLSFFKIYNRWGQLLYSTSSVNQGWDGTFQGLPQGIGTFVYAAEAVDYLGKTVSRKGTVVLIR